MGFKRVLGLIFLLTLLISVLSDDKLEEKNQENIVDIANRVVYDAEKDIKHNTERRLGEQEKLQHNVEDQGRQLNAGEDIKTENFIDMNLMEKSVSDLNDNKEELVNKQQSTDTESLKETENKQNYFSFGNILRSIVDPVLDEFDKHAKKDKKSENINQRTSLLPNDTINSLPTNLSSNITNEGQLETLNKTDKKTKFQCHGRNVTNTTATTIETPQVKIVNNTVLLNMLNFDGNEISDCILVMFFAPWCHFCAETAPNYNALARAFPQLDVVAVDAAQFSNLNARFGTVSVPNILLFHNSKAVVRFNQTYRSFNNLATFVKNITGLNPNTTLNVTDEDYIGPLPSVPTADVDYLLWLSWIFVIICSGFMFVQSSYGQQWINR
ncbi:hypothetical protein KUTeg_006543, partial [Tegillarca granosa]